MCGVMQESAERPYLIESKTGMASLSPLATQSRPRKSASCIQPAMPIDRPASAAPAAHFKRLYRNCPKDSHTHRYPVSGQSR
jgi:hypothetical protein